MKRKVAVLASDNMMPGAQDARADDFERDEQMGKLVPCLAAREMECELVRWREAAARAGEFDAVLPLLCWDYWDDREAFLGEMERAAEVTRVFNAPEVLRWNTDKIYLDQFARGGVPTIPTGFVERVGEADVLDGFTRFDTDTLVIKPQVGAGAWRQALVRRGEPMPGRDALPPGAAMVQPFQDSVGTEGEVSMLWFGGELSHSLKKLPKAGDYRIQSLYGGREVPYEAGDELRELATRVLGALPEIPLYARVDCLRGNDGAWKLIELELVEPYLYFGLSEGEGANNKGANLFADALARVLYG